MAIDASARKNPNTASHDISGNLRTLLLGLSYGQKRMLKVIADVLLIWMALWLAFYLRLGDSGRIHPFGAHAWLFVLAPALSLPLFLSMGLYRSVMRFARQRALMIIALSTALSSILLWFAIQVGAASAAVPRSIPFIYWMQSLLFLCGLRLAARYYLSSQSELRTAFPSGKRVAIYGAGVAGNQLLAALRTGRGMLPVAFIDDNPGLSDRILDGLPVYASSNLQKMLADTNVQEILLALPSISRSRRNEIVGALARLALPVRSVPGFMDLASGRVKVQELREVGIADLLGRDQVAPVPELLERCIFNQTVMVTGAGGSIGSELCRQIVSVGPATLILYDHSEFNLYTIHAELEACIQSGDLNVRLVPILGSVRDHERLLSAMALHNVNTVYHAAAYKHVPMVECNIAEGVHNNVFGTLNTAQAAIQAGVSHFVLISTDKAVRPTNIMGSTKRLSELILQALAVEAKLKLQHADGTAIFPNRTRFTMVRFGNVLGSSGSVIPRFQQQIEAGGPVTVTHPEITRYFMTIPEAAQLVIQAGSMGSGGDVFVLDMGQPVKIAELAKKMVLLSGLTLRSPQDPDGDISIQYTGLRPGEKLYEELLIGDNVTSTPHQKIMRAHEGFTTWSDLKPALDRLRAAVDANEYATVRQIFSELVDGYRPDDHVVDWIHRQRQRRVAPIVSINAALPPGGATLHRTATPPASLHANLR